MGPEENCLLQQMCMENILEGDKTNIKCQIRHFMTVYFVSVYTGQFVAGCVWSQSTISGLNSDFPTFLSRLSTFIWHSPYSLSDLVLLFVASQTLEALIVK